MGQLGVPLIDAYMRELTETVCYICITPPSPISLARIAPYPHSPFLFCPFLSRPYLQGIMDRRGRELVSRFYVHELNLDWRRGASYFGSLLIGYESCSNWGSWASAASLDNGMMRDGADEWKLAEAAEALDPTSSFVKHWLPELRGVPGLVSTARRRPCCSSIMPILRKNSVSISAAFPTLAALASARVAALYVIYGLKRT